MGNLATFEEIATRYEGGENPFDLTIEKWVRIRKSLKSAFAVSHFRKILQATVVKVPFCLETQDNFASCSLQDICSRGEKGSYGKFVRAIQAYCIVGDLLSSSPLLGLVDQIISELEVRKRESL
ncbi:MAG: hypothetical protein GTO13_01080, partial [Proteobacteria bacterium]|nr:hypothetical protein [Pseudomonadota bacterium]